MYIHGSLWTVHAWAVETCHTKEEAVPPGRGYISILHPGVLHLQLLPTFPNMAELMHWLWKRRFYLNCQWFDSFYCEYILNVLGIHKLKSSQFLIPCSKICSWLLGSALWPLLYKVAWLLFWKIKTIWLCIIYLMTSSLKI